jgi:hypothetical protein
MPHKKRMPLSLTLFIVALCIVSIAFIPLMAGCGGTGSTGGTSYQGDWSSGDTATGPQVQSAVNLNNPGQPLKLGDWLQIDGQNFGSTQGSSYVSFSNGQGAIGYADIYSQWTDTQVICRVPLTLTGKGAAPGAPAKAMKVPPARESAHVLISTADHLACDAGSPLVACALRARNALYPSHRFNNKGGRLMANLGGPMLLPMLVVGGVAAAIVNATVNSNQHNADPQPTPPLLSPSPSPSVSPSPSPTPTASLSPSPSPSSSPSPQQALPPIFTPPGGHYSFPMQVTMATAEPGGTVFYTIDGTIPTDASPVYSQPITLTATTTINAITVTPGKLNSTVSSATFTMIINPGTWAPTIGAYQYVANSISASARADGRPRNPITVTTTVDDFTTGSLRAAILLASPGDTIQFAIPGTGVQTIVLNSGEILIDKSLIINGLNGQFPVTVQVNKNLTTGFRAFNITPAGQGTPITVKISDMTIEGGELAYGNGGSIYVGSSATLDLARCTIDGSSAQVGGGIFADYDGYMTLTDSTISNNIAGNGGGGIYASGGNNALQEPVNIATLTNCTISSNSAGADGGGILLGDIAIATITNCTISGNTATGSGGGLGCRYIAYLLNTMVINNSATDGGDIYTGGPGVYAYYCWYESIGANSSIHTQATAPSITTAFNPDGNYLLALALNAPGTTMTMAVTGTCPAVNKGAFVYYSSVDGYYLQGRDGRYYKLQDQDFTQFTPASPATNKITTDQRGETRQQ